MIVLTFRKVCKKNCGYDRSKTWAIDDPCTPNDLLDFISKCKQDKFSSHTHKSNITALIQNTQSL